MIPLPVDPTSAMIEALHRLFGLVALMGLLFFVVGFVLCVMVVNWAINRLGGGY